MTTLSEDIFDGLTSLEIIWIFGDSLTTLSEDIFDGLTSLEWIQIHGDSLTTLPEDIFDGLTSLELIEIHGESLTTLPEDIFDGLTSLRRLRLVGDNLRIPDDDDSFEDLTELTQIRLSYLAVDLFEHLSNLEILSLYNAGLTDLPEGSFDSLTAPLDTLNLACNSLTELNLDRFAAFAATLTSFLISGNPFTTPPTETAIWAKFPLISGHYITLINPYCPKTSEEDETATETLTVSFGQVAYAAAEGGSVTVTVELSADPERTVVIPITAANQGGATDGDYSGVPSDVTFSSGDTSKTFAFDATDDSDDDDDESVLLGFGTLPTGVSAGTPSTSTVAITDDDGLPATVTVSFPQATYSVVEGGTVTVEVRLDAAPGRSVRIPITRNRRDGASNDDFSGVPNSLTFGATETSKTFAFRAVDDSIDDDGESVRLGFGALPMGVTAGGQRTTTVSITDNDVAGVTVNPTTVTVAEGETATYQVKLNTLPAGTVTVTINDPTDNTDVTADTVSLSFDSTNWDTFQDVTVRAAEDDDAEDETATVTHTVSGYGTVTTADSVSVSVTDNEPAVTVSFGQASYSVSEGGTVTVTVALDADPERTVTIPLTTANQGGATDGDYSGVPSDVTFSSGDTSKTITFSATDDSAVDGGESIKLGFGTLPTKVSAGSPDETTVSITDNDVAGVTVNPTTVTVAEGETATYQVKLNTLPAGTVTVTINDPTDNTDVTADTVSLSFDSANWDTFQDVTVRAAEDDDAEDETATVTHTVSGYGTVTTADSVSVSVTDNEPAVTVSFGQTTYTAAEGSSVTVTVELSADPEREVIIPLTATGQDGATDGDYSGVPSDVTFSSGDTSKTFTISATDDSAVDGGESIRLGFGTLPTKVSAGSPDETTVSITDNDGVTAPGAPASLTATPGNAQVTLTWTAPASDGGAAITKYQYRASADGGTNWSPDWTDVPDADSDSDQADERTITVSGLPNNIVHTFQVRGVNSVGGGSQLQATATPRAAGTPPALQSAAISGRVLTLEFSNTLDTNSRPATSAFTVKVRGTTVNLTSVSLSGSTVTLQLISAVTAGDTVTVSYTAPGTNPIKDGDALEAPSFTDEPVTNNTPNAAPTGKPVISGTPQRDQTLTVSTTGIRDADGLTSPDYTYQWQRRDSSVYTDISGANQMVYTLTSEDEGKRVRVVVTFTDDAGNSHTLESSPSGVVQAQTSMPSDKVKVSLDATAYVVEEGETVRITVTLAEAPEEGPVYIRFTVTPANGASRSDFTAWSSYTRQLRFDVGDTTDRINIRANDDTLNDDGETLTLCLGDLPDPYVTLAGLNCATVNIVDNDDPNSVQVTFGRENYWASEDGNPAWPRIWVYPVPDRKITIPITFTRGGGLSAADHETVATSVRFGPGLYGVHGDGHLTDGRTYAGFPIEVWAIDDNDDDDGEYMDLAFGTMPDPFVSVGATGKFSFQPTTTRVWFNDNEFTVVPVTDSTNTALTNRLRVTFADAELEAKEGLYDSGSVATVRVQLSRPRNKESTVIIPILRNPHGATAGVDYSDVPDHLIFLPGQTEHSFRVRAINDDIDDDDEYLTLSFGTLPELVYAGDQATTRIKLVDNDDPPVDVFFEHANYEVTNVIRDGTTEYARLNVKVKLSAAPERFIDVGIVAESIRGGGGIHFEYSAYIPRGPHDGAHFYADDTEFTLQIYISASGGFDPNQTYRLKFKGMSYKMFVGSPAMATITINPDS